MGNNDIIYRSSGTFSSFEVVSLTLINLTCLSGDSTYYSGMFLVFILVRLARANHVGISW